jgi:putative SOS response-associated peptidase YedK
MVEAPRSETWNLALSKLGLVVRSSDAARDPREAVWLSWGFGEGPISSTKPINARVETAASIPIFRERLEGAQMHRTGK